LGEAAEKRKRISRPVQSRLETPGFVKNYAAASRGAEKREEEECLTPGAEPPRAHRVHREEVDEVHPFCAERAQKGSVAPREAR
jgi:hypothetical protein